MACKFADGATDTLGDGMNFAFVGGEEGEDAVGFPKIAAFEDNGFGGVTVLLSHGRVSQERGHNFVDMGQSRRRRADSNRWCSFCRAVPYRLATSPRKKWSGRRGSNPRLSPWQGDALPLSHSRNILRSHV